MSWTSEASTNDSSFNVCEDILQLRCELLLGGLFHTKATTRVILSGTAVSFEWNLYDDDLAPIEGWSYRSQNCLHDMRIVGNT